MVAKHGSVSLVRTGMRKCLVSERRVGAGGRSREIAVRVVSSRLVLVLGPKACWRGCIAIMAVVGMVTAGGLWYPRAAVSLIVPRASFQSVAGNPFGVAVTKNGRYAFVDLFSGRLLVYSISASGPRWVRTIALPDRSTAGSSLTANGRLLLIADGHAGDVVVSVARAVHGAKRPVLGILRPSPTEDPGVAGGAIETTSSADGRYVFVTLEYGNPDGAVVVYDLGNDIDPQLGSTGFVELIPLGQAVVGSALSANGRQLYVTSELAAGASRSADGTLSVIDARRAEHASPHPILDTVPASHEPVRVVVSASGSTVWVTARGDDRLLAFSSVRLKSSPDSARIASVRVGSAPVGLALFDRGRRMIVADSDRFLVKGSRSALTIINTQAALAHRSATVATLPAGQFPREIAIDRQHQTALITNFVSEQLETVPLSRLR